jgi:hypothetical protein
VSLKLHAKKRVSYRGQIKEEPIPTNTGVRRVPTNIYKQVIRRKARLVKNTHFGTAQQPMNSTCGQCGVSTFEKGGNYYEDGDAISKAKLPLKQVCMLLMLLIGCLNSSTAHKHQRHRRKWLLECPASLSCAPSVACNIRPPMSFDDTS